MGGGLFCAGVGNILLIVSTATDYWMQYRHSSNYMHQGLWRYCVPGKCMTHTDSIGKTLAGKPSFIFISLLSQSMTSVLTRQLGDFVVVKHEMQTSYRP